MVEAPHSTIAIKNQEGCVNAINKILEIANSFFFHDKVTFLPGQCANSPPTSAPSFDVMSIYGKLAIQKGISDFFLPRFLADVVFCAVK